MFPRCKITVPGVTFIAAICILVYQLFVPPIAGVADNGDYERVMSHLGLVHTAQSYRARYFDFVNRTYAFSPHPAAKYFSSEIGFAAAGVALNGMYSKSGYFDLRNMGVVHAVVFLSAFLIFLGYLPPQPRWLCGVLAILGLVFFLDIGYISYFNSFYSEGGGLVSLLLIAALCCAFIRKGQITWRGWALFCLAGLVLVTSKAQYAPLSAPFVAAAALILQHRKNESRFPVLKLAAAAALIPVSLYSLTLYPREGDKANLFNIVFFDILPHSNDPASDLEALGLDPALVKYNGVSAWSAAVNLNEPYWDQEFFSKVRRADVGIFYLKRPKRLAVLIRDAADSGFDLDYTYGQLEQAPGVAPGAHCQSFHYWSRLKRKAGPAGTGVLSALTVVVLLLSAAGMRTRAHRTTAGLGLVLLGAAGLQFFAAIYGEGRGDLMRHLFLFNAVTDLLILWCIAAAWQFHAQSTGKPQQ